MCFRQSDIMLGFVGVSVGIHDESVIMIIIASVGSMGRISPAKKREKETTESKKLFASSNESRQLNVDAKNDDVLISGHDAGTSSDGILKDDDMYGVDMTVLEMRIEDGFKE